MKKQRMFLLVPRRAVLHSDREGIRNCIRYFDDIPQISKSIAGMDLNETFRFTREHDNIIFPRPTRSCHYSHREGHPSQVVHHQPCNPRVRYAP